VENLSEQLVLFRGGHHVEAVMVAGQWRVRYNQVLDFDREASRAELHKQAHRLWEQT
jgi:hypothetical protein